MFFKYISNLCSFIKKKSSSISTKLRNFAVKARTSNPNIRIAGYITIGLVLWMMTGIFSSSKDVQIQKSVKILVHFDTKNITASKYQPTINVSGRIQSGNNVFIKSKVDAQVDRVYVKSGQKVSKGAILFKLSGGDSGSGLKQAVAEFNSAKLKMNADRELFSKKLLSKAGFQQAKAQFELAKSMLVNAQYTDNRYYVRAPYTGNLGIIRVLKNQSVNKNTVLADIYNGKDYKFFAYLASTQMTRIAQNDTFTGITANSKKFSGKISAISHVPELQTNTYRIEGKVNQENFANGESGTVSIKLKPIFAHKIPASLLSLDSNGDLGIKIVEEGIVRFKIVKILNENLSELWVSGLPHVATIISKGAGFAKINKPLSE